MTIRPSDLVSEKMLSAAEFFALAGKSPHRSYGLKALPDRPEILSHLDYMERAEDYADYVCSHEKWIDSGGRQIAERIAHMTPEEYEKDLIRVYGVGSE